MHIINRMKDATLVAALVILLFVGCGASDRNKSGEQNHVSSPFASFRDIPGVTSEEIAAIEVLQKQYRSFTFGTTLSTESFNKEDGGVGGYIALYCQWLTELFGIEFDPDIYVLSDLLEKLTSREIDFGIIRDSEERRRIYSLTDAIGQRMIIKIQVEANRTAEGASKAAKPRYLFLQDSSTYEMVSAALDPGTFEALFAADYDTGYHMLKNGEGDAFLEANIAEAAFDHYPDVYIENFLPLLFNPVNMATANPDLAPIISVITKAQRNGAMFYLIDLYDRGYNEYKKNHYFKSLTEEEREYIKNNPTVVIAADYWFYPICFYNKYEKKWEGIAFDAFDEVTKITGINFTLGNGPDTSWTVIYEKLEAGEIPVIFDLIYTEDRAERYVWSRHKYLTENYALVSKQSFPDIGINSIPYSKIGLMKDMGYTVMFNKWFPDAENTTLYDTQENAFRALDKGEIDLLMTGTNTLLSITNYYEYFGYKANFIFDHTIEYSSAFNKNDPVLFSVIEKALKFVDMQKITKQWESKSYDYQIQLLRAQRPWLIGAIILALTVLGLILALFFNNKSEGKRLEKLVSEKTSTLTAILNATSDLIFCKDISSRYTELNKALERYFNRSRANMLGKNNEEALGLSADLALEYIVTDKRVFDEQQVITFEEYIPSSEGELLLFETIKSPIIQDGKVTGLVGISRNITQRKALEEEAKNASEAKSRFIANMSHEIRTPMNAILGITEIQLQEEDITPKAREALERIYNSGDLLLNIINDILDLSKIEAGKLEILPSEYEITSLINDTVTLNTMRSGSKPIEFKLSIDENIPSILYGDELRIKQILNNLLSNAFKYSEKGEVKLSVSAEAEGEDSNVTIVFTVSDTGQGMMGEQIDKLFNEYTRFNMEANRTIEGTGLGMSITRNLIQMMKGEISVRSEINKGSVFTVRLPQGRSGSGVLGRELAENLEKFRVSGAKHLKWAQVIFEPMPYGKILVVDDVESNLYVAKGLMAPYRLTIDTAMSGYKAIEMIKGGSVYDVVFMDHMMPEIDGIEAVKKIRELGYTQPIVALTANAVVGQSDVFMANGFDGFISKPIDVRQLNMMLKKFVRDKQPPEVIEAANLPITDR